MKKFFLKNKFPRLFKKISIIIILILMVQVVFGNLFFINFHEVQAASKQNLCSADVDVVLILDRSGSMEDEGIPSNCIWEELELIGQSYQCVSYDESGLNQSSCEAKPNRLQCDAPVYTPAVLSKFDSAKQAANSFLSNLGSNDQSALVSFADDAVLNQTLTGNHGLTEVAVNALLAGGATNIGGAINLANIELGSGNANPQAVKTAILLTDGRANQPNGNGTGEDPVDVVYAENMASIAAGLGYKIFTIGLGNDVNSAMLQNIANITGAEYYHSPTANELRAIYDLISSKLCEYGSISGCKYNDTNGDAGDNGIDTNETKLDNWEIVLDNGSSIISQKTVNGCYSFAGLEDGDYILTEVLANGWKQTYPGAGYHAVTISNNNDITGVDFANYLIPVVTTGTISGCKWEDDGDGLWEQTENSLAGWEIELREASSSSLIATTTTITTTSGELGFGCYEFNDIDLGTYYVVEKQQVDWQQTYPNINTPLAINLNDNYGYEIVLSEESSIVDSVDFGNQKVYSISGYKYNDINNNSFEDDDGVIISDWEMRLITCPYAPLDKGELQFLPNVNIDLNSASNTPGACTLISTTTTDNLGYYNFNNLPIGDYGIIEAMRTGWQQTYPVNNQFYYFNLDQSTSTINFANYQLPYCGDGACNNEETCSTCSSDCGSCGGGGAYCGDNSINQSNEECDDGNNINGDGCDSYCHLETYCGDNVCNGNETCSTCNDDCGSCGGSTPLCVLRGDCENNTGTTQDNTIVLGEEGAPLLVITKGVTPHIVNPGDILNYSILLTNNGNLDAFNVSLTDTLPDGLVFLADESVIYSWNLGDIPVGESRDVNYQVKVLADVTAGTYTNTAVARADNYDDISATAEVEVEEVAVLAATGNSWQGFGLLLLLAISALYGSKRIKQYFSV